MSTLYVGSGRQLREAPTTESATPTYHVVGGEKFALQSLELTESEAAHLDAILVAPSPLNGRQFSRVTLVE